MKKEGLEVAPSKVDINFDNGIDLILDKGCAFEWVGWMLNWGGGCE